MGKNKENSDPPPADEKDSVQPLREETIGGTALGIADGDTSPAEVDEAEAEEVVDSIW